MRNSDVAALPLPRDVGLGVVEDGVGAQGAVGGLLGRIAFGQAPQGAL